MIRLSCPLCREACRSSELNYVKLHDGTGDGQEGELTGNNHASKIMKVAQTLAWISRNDEGAKALVFSSVRGLIIILSLKGYCNLYAILP